MPEKPRDLSKEQAPDPSRSYERAKPEAEAGMGKLDAPQSVPSQKPDRVEKAVDNKQPNRQVNADDVVNTAGNKIPPTGQAAHGGEKPKNA